MVEVYPRKCRIFTIEISRCQFHMAGLLRQGHFLGSRLRSLRKRNGLTLEELSTRCVQLDARHAPSVSYLSMVETGKRVPSGAMLAVLAAVFGKEPAWFLDRQSVVANLAEADESVTGATGRAASSQMPLEPGFLFSRELLQIALPELLAQTGTSGTQFARLLVRTWQETRRNEFPDIERAAETVGRRRMPLSLDEVLAIVREAGLTIRWADDERGSRADRLLRARFEAPGTIVINRRLQDQESRLKYTLAFFVGHRILHNGDGVVPPHSAAGAGLEDVPTHGAPAAMSARDVLLAWRDFECSAFAGALLCPKQPFRRFLVRERHELAAGARLGITPAVMMRRMTAVSPYRHWHFFDGYEPGYLRAVYRGNGIPLPWGNMSLVPDPCPHWAVFRLLRDHGAEAEPMPPVSQVSVMHDGTAPRLFCCHSLRTRDAAGASHVLSVGIDLAPAFAAQGLDAGAIVAGIDEACRRAGGSAALPGEAADAIRTVGHVLNIAWVARSAEAAASLICPRSSGCPRPSACASTLPRPAA
jgi:transcriptional regulator with XRE-family HTH domain